MRLKLILRISFFLLFLCRFASAQNSPPKFQFKNLLKKEAYNNKKQSERIRQLEESGDELKLITALEEYVQEFNLANLNRNTDYVWKLAQLYEKAYRLSDALHLYRILLRNGSGELDSIRLFYNNANRYQSAKYVPIKYYYDLLEQRKRIDTLRPPVGVFTSMGDNINSDLEDYAPTIDIEQNTLVFTSKRHMTFQGANEDLFYSLKDDDGNWRKSQPFSTMNSVYNEGSPYISPDGKTLLFSRCKSPDGFGNCDLYISKLDPNHLWSKPENLGKNINGPDWDSHPTLSHSGDTLFFASNRPGGFGETDLYFSVKDKKGRWQPAENIGPTLNSSRSELSPFYHPFYPILYFSSNGQDVNFGNFDIFKSTNSGGNWSDPYNIGPLINGPGNEYYFAIDAASKNLYYARSLDNDNKNLDLYSYPLPMEGQPLATTTFSGKLSDSLTDKAFKGIVSIVDLETGIEVAPRFMRSDGSFDFSLINDKKYLLVLQGEDFFRIERQFELRGDTVFNLQTNSLAMMKLQFKSVEFDNNSDKIRPQMEEDLNKLVSFLIDNPSMGIRISGHTDSRGLAENNMLLSEKRANSIKRYLIETGQIDENRIEAKGFGSTKPIVKEEKTDADRELNRRVEFEFIRLEQVKSIYDQDSEGR